MPGRKCVEGGGWLLLRIQRRLCSLTACARDVLCIYEIARIYLFIVPIFSLPLYSFSLSLSLQCWYTLDRYCSCLPLAFISLDKWGWKGCHVPSFPSSYTWRTEFPVDWRGMCIDCGNPYSWWDNYLHYQHYHLKLRLITANGTSWQRNCGLTCTASKRHTVAPTDKRK